MLEMILDRYILYVLTGGIAVCGILSKLIVSVSLKRLVKAAGNMNKSTHPLMRLVRAKFEHACMISEKVENVRVFVDKYLYEYRVMGLRLHTLRRMECAAAGADLVLGAAGAALVYSVQGMNEEVLRVGGFGAGLGIIVFVIHLTTDENYRLEMARNYMVDYLENVCLHRYEKAYQKETRAIVPEVPIPSLNEEGEDIPGYMPDDGGEEAWEDASGMLDPVRPQPGREVPSPRTSPESLPPAMPEPYETPDVTVPVQGIRAVEKGRTKMSRHTEPGAGALMSRALESEIQAGQKQEARAQGAGQKHKKKKALRENAEPSFMQMTKAEQKVGTEQAAKAEQTAKLDQTEKTEQTEKSPDVSRDVIIRQILEEFMA